MLTAEEARNKTKEAISRNFKDQLKLIEKHIDETIERGKFEITVEGRLTDYTVEKLKELGYLVEYKYKQYSISWK